MMEKLDDLVAENCRWILRQALRYCRNRMDAEDLAGDAIVRILSSRELYDDKKPFRPWCSVVILNTYITRYNHDNIVRFIPSDKISDIVAAPEDASSGAYVAEILDAIIKCNCSSSIGCVVLYAKGYSYEEIASELCIPVGTVRSRISYGRNKLRRMLEING